MKDNRVFIEEIDGWPGKCVNFLSTYESGITQKNVCSSEEWKAYEIKKKIVEAGIKEKLVDELYSIACSIGYNEAETSYNDDY